MFGNNTDSYWEIFAEDGFTAYMNGQYSRAESLYKAALGMAEHGKEALSHGFAKLLTLMGDLYSDQKQYGLAESCFRRAVSIYQRDLPASDVDVSICLRRMSEMCRAQGKSAESLLLGECAYESMRERRNSLEDLLLKKGVAFDR